MSRPALIAALLLLPLGSSAYVVNITAGTRSIYLQVGTGTMTGGNFNAGGTPGNNATVNNVTVTVPAGSLGAGTQPMTTNSTVTNSPYDGFAFCPVTVPARWVYIGGYYRRPTTGGGTATLTVTSPANLVSGADTIPFNTISWVGGGTGDNPATIASGTFVGGTTQLLRNVGSNTWFEGCLQFNYANTAVLPAGTYTNRVTYTLTAP